MAACLQNLADLSCKELLANEFSCECGRLHSVDIRNVTIENGAIHSIPRILKESAYKKAFILADTNTYEAAGATVEDVIRDQIKYEKLVFRREADLVPDERTLGELLIHVPADADVIIALGTGVLNDLAKFMSHKVHLPYIIVATAPSMDGFASDGAALIVDNVKVSFSACNAVAIIGDVDVLKKAPMNMIAAGLGDMLGKYSALRDWKLAHVIDKEYYCKTVETMIRQAVYRCVENIDGLRKRDDTAIKNLMEGLVLTGIAMSFAGSSRPASGSEHHLSHFWEMLYLLDGRAAILHGTKVGIATLLMNRLSELLVERPVEEIEAKKLEFNQEQWENSIKKVYRDAAPGIITLAETVNRNSIEAKCKRIAIIKENWPAIVNILQEGASSQQIETWLSSLGSPVRPSEIGIEKELLFNGIKYGKEVRARYTLLQLLWDIDLLDEYAEVSQDWL